MVAKSGPEIRSRHPLETHRNRQTDLTGVRQRMSKMVSFDKGAAVASDMPVIRASAAAVILIRWLSQSGWLH